MVNFDVTQEEDAKILKIVERALAIAEKHGRGKDTYPQVEMMMDLTACHANGNKLNLDGLLTASDGDLVHDVFGIGRHIDRRTGKLGDCFSPRYSVE